MTDNVIDMTGKTAKRAAQPNAKVIKFLKDLLTEAEAGNVQQIAAVWQEGAGLVQDGYSPGGHPNEIYPIIGGLEVCKATLLNEILASERPFE